MGQQVQCRAEFDGKSSEGTAQLETDHLVFRGAFRVSIPLKDIRAVRSTNGVLRVKFSGGEAAFHLGPKAEKWAENIRSPKSLLDKLGVKPDFRVSVVGVKDDGFLKDLRARGADVSIGRLRKASDMVFMAADKPRDLKRLERVEPYMKRDGAVWVVSPKGRPEVRDVVVIQAGVTAGLVDTKVVRFSDSHTALKFVIPVARR
ncbi:MAG TPA: hypothetical protein VHI54_08315 [Actinomycetota bacterium]|nr:hypothetical protein [Actinomycetota bacterium]